MISENIHPLKYIERERERERERIKFEHPILKQQSGPYHPWKLASI